MATSKRDEYLKTLNQNSVSSDNVSENLTDTIIKDIENKNESSSVKVTETKKVGRPAKEPKRPLTLYVPVRQEKLLKNTALLYGFKSVTEYISSLIETDLNSKKNEVEKFMQQWENRNF